MRVEVDNADGYPTQVRVMTDNGYWTTFWRASDCQGRSLRAAQDATALATERVNELMSALAAYALNDDEFSIEESLASVGLKSDLIEQIREHRANTEQ